MLPTMLGPSKDEKEIPSVVPVYRKLASTKIIKEHPRPKEFDAKMCTVSYACVGSQWMRGGQRVQWLIIGQLVLGGNSQGVMEREGH